MNAFWKFIKWKENNKTKFAFANKLEFNKGIITRTSNIISKDATNYRNEKKVLRLIKKENIIPKVLKFKISKNQVLLKRLYVEGNDFTKARFDFVDHFKFIHNEIKKLHSVRNKGVTKFSIDKTLEYYPNNKIDRNMISNASKYLETGELVLSHGDCWPNNIILGHNRIWLIDFEYSCVNDFLFDYSILSIGLEIPVEKIHELLKLNEEEKIRLNEWIYFNKQLYIEWINKNYDPNLEIAKQAIDFLKE